MSITRRSTLLAVGLAAALAVGSCIGGTAVQAQAPIAATHVTLDKSKKMSVTAAAAIDAAAAGFPASSADKAPALWLAVWDPKRGYYEQAYGNAVLPSTAAVVADHVRIGSITKTVMATAVLEQVAAHKLSLSDSVAKLDPKLARILPQIAKYTVRQLLSMQTQIPDYADAAVAIMGADPSHRFTRYQLIRLGLDKGKKIGPAGGYSTTNYIILGELMRRVSGKTPEALVNGVFRQAGMNQSRLTVAGPMPAPAASGYLGVLGTAELAAVNSALTPDTDAGAWPLDWGQEGGGAYSTIGDLASWGGTCLGNSLLPASLAEARLQTHAIDAGQYGLGIKREGDWLAHGGQVLGFTSNVACNPKTGAVVAYVTNSTYGTFDVKDAVGAVAFPEYSKAK